MRHIRQTIKRLAMIMPALVLTLGLMSFYGGAIVHAAPTTVPITGMVTDHDNNALGDVRVTVNSADDGSTVASTLTYTDATTTAGAIPSGSYILNVPAGTYNIIFQPQGTLWNSVTESNVSVSSAVTINEQLAPIGAAHALHGSVTDGNGSPVAGMDINAYSTNGAGIVVYTHTDIQGNYTVTVPDAQYGVTGYGRTVQNVNLPRTFEYVDHDVINVSGADATENLQLPATVTLAVLVKDKVGNPDPGQQVVLDSVAQPGNGSQNPYVLTETETITTDANGIAALPVWQGYAINSGSNVPIVRFTSDNIVAYNQTLPLPMTSDTSIEIDEVNGVPANLTPPVLSATLTNGFPTLQWTSIPNASSYELVRDLGTNTEFSVYIPAPTTTFTDTDATPGVHTYNVYSTVNDADGPFSNTVTVTSTGQQFTPPTITYSANPVPNAAGWNTTPVTITYDCEASAGIASCTPPQTLATDGTNQTSTGTVTDDAGQSNSATTDPVNIDMTPPTVSNFTLTRKTSTQAEAFHVAASDATSGIAGGEFYYGTDPGQGNGTPMSYNGSQLDGTLDTTMPVGTYQVFVRSQDVAGNWSSPVSTKLVVTKTGTTGVTASGSYTPSTTNGDQLPSLGSNVYNLAQYNGNVNFGNNGVTNGSNLSFTYKYGSTVLCGVLPILPSCHQATMTASGTNLSSITFSGSNNAQVTITGILSVTVDSVTTTNPFQLSLYSAARGGSGTNSYNLSVYTPGSTMTPANLLYHAVNSGTVTVQ